jgi:hypothetical protein
LTAREIQGARRTDTRGISIVQVANLNIWVEPKCFTWSDGNGGHIRLPLIDLQEAVELVLHRIHECQRAQTE